jgi:hypothetical protein
VTVAKDRTGGPLILEKHVGFAAMAGWRKTRANMAKGVWDHGSSGASQFTEAFHKWSVREGKQLARLSYGITMLIPEM